MTSIKCPFIDSSSRIITCFFIMWGHKFVNSFDMHLLGDRVVIWWTIETKNLWWMEFFSKYEEKGGNSIQRKHGGTLVCHLPQYLKVPGSNFGIDYKFIKLEIMWDLWNSKQTPLCLCIFMARDHGSLGLYLFSWECTYKTCACVNMVENDKKCLKF